MNEPDETALEKFGAFEIVRELDRGATARVLEARHVALDKRVAIKILHPQFVESSAVARRFLDEGRMASRIHHPHVVEVFDVGVQAGAPWLSMELLEGENLGQLLEREGRLGLARVAELLLPVISAIAAAHDAGVVHRDLKPSNIFLSQRGRSIAPKVLDFGISKRVSRTPRDQRELTDANALLGTVPYMAPEQTAGARNVSAATDQYSLAVVLYEAATGELPFDGETPYEIMHAIVTDPLVLPSEVEPRLPPGFDAMIARAMSRNAAERFADIRELGHALHAFAEGTARAVWAEEFGAMPSRSARMALAPLLAHPIRSGATAVDEVKAAARVVENSSLTGALPARATGRGVRGSVVAWGMTWLALLSLVTVFVRGAHKKSQPRAASWEITQRDMSSAPDSSPDGAPSTAQPRPESSATWTTAIAASVTGPPKRSPKRAIPAPLRPAALGPSPSAASAVPDGVPAPVPRERGTNNALIPE